MTIARRRYSLKKKNILAIMPWNYPFWQFFRFFAPAIAAGNGTILKHASNVPGCALAIEDVLKEAGVPGGLSRSLLVQSKRVAALIADNRIAAVTLTGSTGVGQSVAAEAGSHIKKQVLELGGTDPFIVLADADIERAAEIGAKARFQNCGQSCIAAKRFIVEEKIADAFVKRFVEHVRALKIGDPLAAGTQVGPMARTDLRDELHTQVERSLAEGAKLVLGGAPIHGAGAFYQRSSGVSLVLSSVMVPDSIQRPSRTYATSPFQLDTARVMSDLGIAETQLSCYPDRYPNCSHSKAGQAQVIDFIGAG